MRKLFYLIFILLNVLIVQNAYAILSLELTRGVAGAIPIAISSFNITGNQPTEDITRVISSDLQNSGRFKVTNNVPPSPQNYRDLSATTFKNQGTDNVVIGQIKSLGGNSYQISFQLIDTVKGQVTPTAVLLNKTYTVTADRVRPLAHHISDLVYEQLLGIKGVFSTRIAYVVVQRSSSAPTRYILEVSDQDGYNPRPLLTSTDPIMSPSWSPNGKQIAYVSFENRKASIYVQNVSTGARFVVSQTKGINGAPAWSPDGRKLAVVLSKDGSPNIYILDLTSRQLTRMTHDWSINTEPAWAPNGKTLVFTSNRGGGPQIYQLNVATKAISRVSYDGDYNARASFTADGNHIAMLHREGGVYDIGLLDLDSGSFHLLTNTNSDNESPSIAPNGSMVLYGSIYGGRSILGMVSSDGRVQLRLPARNGEVQDPAWSPFLT